ncbi:intraflagellar transport protein 57-like protein [Leptotrombidium deliense]|uniref:Intraflagellar transport protein 57-like protein n=1 Tax=Leptotrombidium deliense TaxID=299467 RepID=A0A443SW82_9ACAR|nr:intraflagellar transport protein 57-like protein [Leptotrombidium deliense]
MSDSQNAEDNESKIDDSQSPGFHFVSTFQLMHNLNERLILLDYREQFCSQYKCKPIHRYYFAVQTNPGEQFYTFSCLSAWLIKTKCKFTESHLNPQEYEDPNVTIHAILEALRFLVDPVPFPPNRLKQGYGQEVIWVLNQLAEDAIKKDTDTIRSTISVKGLMTADQSENEILEDDNEIEMNFEDQYTLVEDTADTELDLETRLLTQPLQTEKPKGFLVSQIDSSEWKLEIERVLPQLKVVLRTNDHKADWRQHVNEMYTHRNDVESHFAFTQNSLKKMSSEINKSLEKISGREKYLQLQLEPLINEYNNLNNHLIQINDNYKAVSSGVTEKSRQLASISDTLDAVKSEMEERGSSMTDGTPLVTLRKALSKVKSEIGSIDIRIGVAMNTLLQVKARELSDDTLPVLMNKTSFKIF